MSGLSDAYYLSRFQQYSNSWHLQVDRWEDPLGLEEQSSDPVVGRTQSQNEQLFLGQDLDK